MARSLEERQEDDQKMCQLAILVSKAAGDGNVPSDDEIRATVTELSQHRTSAALWSLIQKGLMRTRFEDGEVYYFSVKDQEDQAGLRSAIEKVWQGLDAPSPDELHDQINTD